MSWYGSNDKIVKELSNMRWTLVIKTTAFFRSAIWKGINSRQLCIIHVKLFGQCQQCPDSISDFKYKDRLPIKILLLNSWYLVLNIPF